MHTIIANLSIIADAAEKADKATSAAWRIRSSLTNMMVWAANALIYANKTDSNEARAKAMITLATLRVWKRDCCETSFILDLTPEAVRRTLGLERVTDVTEDAKREAARKCRQNRSAARFVEYYKAALNAFEERRKERESRVEEIANLLADNSFTLDMPLADTLNTFFGVNVHEADNNGMVYKSFITDEELYDDSFVETQLDTISEVIANASESLYEYWDGVYASSIIEDRATRAKGYRDAATVMMKIVGVDVTRLAERKAKLEALLKEQADTIDSENKSLDEQIEAQLAEINTPAEPAPTPAEPKRNRVPTASVKEAMLAAQQG